jgi:hypothetical protein
MIVRQVIWQAILFYGSMRPNGKLMITLREPPQLLTEMLSVALLYVADVQSTTHSLDYK